MIMLSRLRKNNGAIEYISRLNQLCEIRGWSTQQNPKLEVIYPDSKTIENIEGKASNRADLNALNKTAFEFRHILRMRECADVSFRLLPRVLFQRKKSIDSAKLLQRASAVQHFSRDEIFMSLNQFVLANVRHREAKSLESVPELLNFSKASRSKPRHLIIVNLYNDTTFLNFQLSLLELSNFGTENEESCIALLSEIKLTPEHSSKLVDRSRVLFLEPVDLTSFELSINAIELSLVTDVTIVREGILVSDAKLLCQTVKSLRDSNEKSKIICFVSASHPDLILAISFDHNWFGNDLLCSPIESWNFDWVVSYLEKSSVVIVDSSEILTGHAVAEFTLFPQLDLQKILKETC